MKSHTSVSTFVLVFCQCISWFFARECERESELVPSCDGEKKLAKYYMSIRPVYFCWLPMVHQIRLSVLRLFLGIHRVHPPARMAEDTGTATLGSTKRCRDQVTSQSSSKRVKVDTQPGMGANPPNPNPDTPQISKKSQKRRDAAGYPRSRQGKEKDGGKNVGRRRRDGPETREAADVASEADTRLGDAPVTEKPPRLPKRQSAILLGFCGTGCAGMQMSVCRHRFHLNQGVHTPPFFF